MPRKQQMQNNNKPKVSFTSYANLMSLGIEMALTMILPVLGGYYLESVWTISPWGIVSGALFGFVSSFWLVYKRVILKK